MDPYVPPLHPLQHSKKKERKWNVKWSEAIQGENMNLGDGVRERERDGDRNSERG